MSNNGNSAVIVWGNQLSTKYNSALAHDKTAPVIMIEGQDICDSFTFHKQKLAFVLTCMREFADDVSRTRTLQYVNLSDSEPTWFETLEKICATLQISKLVAMRAHDRGPQTKLEAWCRQHNITLEITPNTLFLTPQSEFRDWADDQKRLHMEQFYHWQRKRLNIMIDSDGKPAGGRWNYDSENRKSLPKDYKVPVIDFPKPSKHWHDVCALVEQKFSDNPGSLTTSWLPTTRQQALSWLDQFFEKRFNHFGDYEDAMLQGEPFINHSILSPLMNIGLLHPQEIIAKALQADAPLAGREGFIRQIIGWREFMFGLYHYKPVDWVDSNYFGAKKQLESYWWTLSDAPEPPLTDVFERLKQYGYSHHIERLMVLGNYMLLNNYDPKQIYKWFMTMYVDAYEWVMVPNVIGMSQYADGGIEHGGFATKPYISGSNYLQKMGKWWPSGAAAKESGWTNAYWNFLARHETLLAHNYRLRPLMRAAKAHQDASQK